MPGANRQILRHFVEASQQSQLQQKHTITVYIAAPRRKLTQRIETDQTGEGIAARGL